jgi:hypothetical protein
MLHLIPDVALPYQDIINLVGNSGPEIILIIIIVIITLIICFFYAFKEEPNKFFKNRKYTFKFYGLKNESMYKFLLHLIIIYIIQDLFTRNITIAFYEIRYNKLIRLSNDCHIIAYKNISYNELYSYFDGWSNSAFNNEYNHIIVKVEINTKYLMGSIIIFSPFFFLKIKMCDNY